MGIVINPNKWREDSLKGLKCARIVLINQLINVLYVQSGIAMNM